VLSASASVGRACDGVKEFEMFRKTEFRKPW